MVERPVRTIDQPLRASFLRLLPAAERELVERFAWLLEAALTEWVKRPPSDDLRLELSRAGLEDLAALLDHQRDAVAGWSGFLGEESEGLRQAMREATILMEDAYRTLSEALEEDPLASAEEGRFGP